MEETPFTFLSQPDIYFGSLRIAEPVTTLTGLLVACFSIIAWFKLGACVREDAVNRYLRSFFLLMALGTAIGGVIGHAFLYLFPIYWKLPGWVISMLGVSALEHAAILQAKPYMRPYWNRFLRWACAFEIVFFIGLVCWFVDFRLVELQAAIGFLVVMGILQAFVYQRTRNEGSLWLLGAIPIAVMAVIPHVFKISISVWFNHFDLGHLVMCAVVFVLWKGAEGIKLHREASELKA